MTHRPRPHPAAHAKLDPARSRPLAEAPADRRQWLQDAAALALGCSGLLALAGCAAPQGAPSPKAGASAPHSAPPAVAPARTGPPPTLVVHPFELVDEHDNPGPKAAQQRRLVEATRQLRRELAEAGLYRVVDAAPAQGLLDQMAAQQAFFYRCDSCAQQLGQALQADLVMTPWVQKVSELILNLNVQIVDTRRGVVVFSKSVDMRSNVDESWQRAVRYLVRDMVEKRARRADYGT